MTPLAARYFRDNISKSKVIARAMPDTLYFECSQLVSLCLEMRPSEKVSESGLTEWRVPPHASTWIEFIHKNRRAAGWTVIDRGGLFNRILCFLQFGDDVHFIGEMALGLYSPDNGKRVTELYRGLSEIRVSDHPDPTSQRNIRFWCHGIAEMSTLMIQMINQPRFLEYTHRDPDKRISRLLEPGMVLERWRECRIRPGSHGISSRGEGENAHMPLHYVRRHYRPRLKIWVEGYWRGDIKYGIVRKTYTILEPDL